MTTLTFQNKTLSVINQNNQMWMTVTEIGNALGYSDPFKSVKNIYDRHQDEFTPCMTALVDMQTAGGMQKVRIFSLRGIGYNKSTKAHRANQKAMQANQTAPNRVESACNQATICGFIKSRKRVDITNYNCNKKTNKAPTVRAKEKRRLGFKEPR